MSEQRSVDTAIELRLRRLLHGLGLRYRVHQRPLSRLHRTADIVFRPVKVAVFVDGCFWHGCQTHSSLPKTNAAFWMSKLEGNRQRDRDTDRLLDEEGWLVIRVWEHDKLEEAALAIADAVAVRRAG